MFLIDLERLRVLESVRNNVEILKLFLNFKFCNVN